MNKKLVLATVATVGGLAVTAGTVSAFQGDPSVQGPYYSQERHTAMEQAFENNDYNAWKELMAGKGRVTQVVTEENFARFAQAHELAEEGKLDEAQQIRRELGLGLRNGGGNSQGRGQGQGRWAK